MRCVVVKWRPSGRSWSFVDTGIPKLELGNESKKSAIMKLIGR